MQYSTRLALWEIDSPYDNERPETLHVFTEQELDDYIQNYLELREIDELLEEDIHLDQR